MATLDLSGPARPTLRTSKKDVYVKPHRIFCVGRNYADHALEMGHDPDAEPPFFFMKPASALVPSGRTIPYPLATENLHHEAELAIILAHGGTNIARGDALAAVYGYAAANDLTRRDLQAEAKQQRRPWDMAKGFDNSAVIGLIHRERPDPDAQISCTVDGALRQVAKLSDMIWPIEDIIAYLSKLVTLEAGDIIMTGTPAGVGPLERGQTCSVEIEGLSNARVTID